MGRACRLPGATDVGSLWEMLRAGRCEISAIPPDRWALARYGHPRIKEPGRSYTWAAGVLSDIWGFDPSVFRISPREAPQIDPQQRLLLELAFEACEDAGFAPSKLAGSQTGVYVGASSLDYSTFGMHDPSVGNAYFATGNTLSIVSNRLSFVFDLHGPSLTVDTACSSSLVALHEARHALARGEIDAALVGGVNVLLSPFPFIGFSQAAMLSRTGLCRAFAAGADGYVRAEGAVVLVLKTVEKAIQDGDRIHAVICGSAVNSDGRTSGISQPSEAQQVNLLRSAYSRAGVPPSSVVYVEAHGTGTRVGDPVEAAALGKVLGCARTSPLPIGSIKTNIGHTEPASGLVGLLKAMLALERNQAPKSLHFDNPNPNIDFTGLNLLVASEAIDLPRDQTRRFAGVSAFGFGGTSAHVIVTDPPVPPRPTEANPRLLMLSAQTETALRALAGEYALRFAAAGATESRRIVAATNYRRELMRERLVLPADDRDALVPALAQFAQFGHSKAASTRASAVESDGAVVFVFSGNGSQWPSMGRAAYQSSAAFRDALAEIDSHLSPLTSWSLTKELRSPNLTNDLTHTDIAQPMIFGIQAATVRALARVGVRPSMTIGHSVGEVAAAEAAGVLSLRDAVRVIHSRSRLQERTKNAGGMAVVFGSREAALELVVRIENLSVAAHNSQQCIAVAGPNAALAELTKLARERRIRVRRLELPYPFHTGLMQPLKQPLLESLATLKPLPGAIPFLSTITDSVIAGDSVGAAYWWRNVRDTVLFQEAIERAIRSGKRVFLEVGPRATLKTHLRDVAEHLDAAVLIDCALGEDLDEACSDPFEAVATRLLAAGADVDPVWAFGPDPGAGVDLPAYPWRRVAYRFGETSETTGQLISLPRHPLIGGRDREGTLEWRAILDPDLEPALGDHRLDGQILLPGAAFLEMGLAIARDWVGGDAALSGFEILQPLIFAPDVSREVLCRVSPSTAMIEIMSRPRLSRGAYTMHARGSVIQKPGPVPVVSSPPAVTGGVESDTLYARALPAGLEYGPAYRRLARANWLDEGVIVVELTSQGGDSRFGLDPAQLDSCFHGLIFLVAETQSQSGAYLPVRFEEARLIAPGASLARASIRVKRHDARFLLADLDLFDGEGRLVAFLRGARCQAVRRRASGGLEQFGLVRNWISLPAGNGRTVRSGQPLSLESRGAAELPRACLLIEGWATATTYQLARRLAKDKIIDVDALVLEGRLSPDRRLWLETAFAALEQSGLIVRDGALRRVIDRALPEPDAVYWTLAAQHPDRSPELLLAAHAGAASREFDQGKIDLVNWSDAAIDAYELRSPSVIGAARALGSRLDKIVESMVSGSGLRILQIGVGPVSAEAVRFAADQGGRLTIFDPNSKRLERARLRHGHGPETSFCSDLDSLASSSFDLVVSAGGLSRLAAKPGALKRITEACAPGALIVAVEPAPSLFHSLVLAGEDGEFGGQHELRRDAESWKVECGRAGLGNIEAHLGGTQADHAVFLIAEAPGKAEMAVQRSEMALMRIGDAFDGYLMTLFDALRARGVICRIFDAGALSQVGEVKTFVWLMGDVKGDGMTRVAECCMALRAMALGVGHTKVKVFVAMPSSDRAVAEAIFGFVRTLANEFQTIEFRRIEIVDVTPKSADRLAALILSGGEETDMAVEETRVRALRYAMAESVDPRLEKEGAVYRLEKSPEGGLDRLAWNPVERRALEGNEVEVEVAATGLNFRDVMWALSILPDDMLEDGLAGPTLGLEFSGRVARVGSAIERFRIGDEVLGLSGGAFATHVIVDGHHLAKLPAQLPIECAAAVPVAFLTSYYGLISCADLQRGEWVLIHGGAGGVGLAALQIAQWRGARAIVTAGSPEKRSLARAFGAEHAFDSRSGAFVDEVMRATEHRGVSVVLNSLAGESMERSIGLLQPFGRFVELGKRDYLANTPIGLRPFRRNLSYFGVDLDQLLSLRPELSHRLFEDVLNLFAAAHFTPLPYSAFAHNEVVEAMRLMQQSGHIGKILVRPPPRNVISEQRKPARPFTVDSHRNHLIVGGLGGFGIAAAEWLVGRGARYVTLVGRTGVSNELARETIARLQSQGAQVRVDLLDIADREATSRLFADLALTMPPLAGVMHAAMVLDDATVANIDEASLLKVLRPKIAGAENLDRLTRGLALDYFILFSSAATVVGNPGQGAYVAANGFLEGLARERRSAGLPALAISWGGIADVGLLARDGATRDALAHRAGMTAIKAQTALDLMAQALSVDGGPGGDAVIAIADMNWSVARTHLPILKSPSYNRLGGDETASDAPSKSRVDLSELTATLGPDQARRAVSDILVEEIARILRLPREDVSRTRPLAEIGLDSLMAVELMLSLEDRLTVDVPLGNSAGAFNVADLAGQLLSSSQQDERKSEMALSSVKRHLDLSGWDDIAPLVDILREEGVDLPGAPVRAARP